MIKKIIVFTPDPPPAYARKDIEVLGSAFDVKIFYLRILSQRHLFLELFKQFFFLIKNIKSVDLYLCMFIGYHTFLPTVFAKIFKKKIVLIPGGMDCVSFPSINYGNFNKGLLSKITEYSYKNATHIIPVTEKLVKYKYEYTNNDYPFQGYEFFCKNISTPYTAITVGYNQEKWKRNLEKKKNLFLTVAYNVNSERGFALKGLDSVVKIAELFPNQEFCIVGITEPSLIKEKPDNLKISPNVAFSELLELFNKAEFYIQLSISEGFPSTFCEAMLCECVPIGSKVGAIPDIIGDCGFIVEKKEDSFFEETIKKALSCNTKELGKNARKRIIELFPEHIREEKIINLIKSL